MPYITKATLFKIGGILDIPYEKSNNAKEAINKIIKEYTKEKILAPPELGAMAQIISVNEILNSETPENIKIKTQIKLDSEAKKRRIVYYKETMTYHHYDNCPNLSSDYENFTIPEKIPDEKIDEYRKYFIAHKELFYKDEQAFYARAGSFFGIPLTGTVVIKSHYSNSGKNTASSNNLLSNSNDDAVGFHLENLLSFYQKNKPVIVKFGQASHLINKFLEAGKIKEEEHTLISEWHILKSNAKSEIIKKITGINNISEQRFSEEVLVSLGFNECSTCKSIYRKT